MSVRRGCGGKYQPVVVRGERAVNCQILNQADQQRRKEQRIYLKCWKVHILSGLISSSCLLG